MFFIICILLRLFLVYYTKNNDISHWFLYIASLISFGFMFLYVTGLRKTGMEVSDPSKIIWWNHVRPFHSIMYFLFVITTIYKTNINNIPINWMFLLTDVSIGLLTFWRR